jgi:transcriptional regulator with GAF, ATPase, and Fis domain
VDASLSERLAEVARELQSQNAVATTAEQLVQHAIEWAGHDSSAGISLAHRRRRVESVAPSDEIARKGDQYQEQLQEGPCLDAIWEHSQVDTGDLGNDERWPHWGRRMSEEFGINSMLCTRLFTHEDTVGGVNLYSPRHDAFDEDIADAIATLAAHGAVAVASAQEIEGLKAAMDRRTTIGKALGMIMERYDIDDARAFEVLKRVSSHSNRKLYDIAVELVTTRKLTQ